jgi:hypothetical protein
VLKKLTDGILALVTIHNAGVLDALGMGKTNVVVIMGHYYAII